MKIEKGKKYRDKMGDVHTIMGEWAPVRPGHFCFQDDQRNLYTAEGKKNLNHDEHVLDLVKEFIEETK